MSVWGHLKQIFGPEPEWPPPCDYGVPAQTEPELPAFQKALPQHPLPRPDPADKRPRLRAVRRPPSREDFAQWLELPVTRFVMAAFRAQAQLCEATWHDQTWEAGIVDPKALTDLKARADTYMALEDSSYEAFCDACGVDPEPVPINKEQT
jgi:hypothetical protein